MHDRFFFHSFPRPKHGEAQDAVQQKGLKILNFMRNTGLVLAPEIIDWDISGIVSGDEKLKLLQQRLCFTEISTEELPERSKHFGPFAISFETGVLRTIGATPVIYIPQGVKDQILSQIGTFAVRGAYHTRHVLQQLQGLKENCDRDELSKKHSLPIAENCTINLINTGSKGEVVHSYTIPIDNVQAMLKHLGFNNIPFDHSVGILNLFLNMFYPTDNNHADQELGYYRQREWRLVAGDIKINGRSLGRKLLPSEKDKLLDIDRGFWSREIEIEKTRHQRVDLALVYDPLPDWDLITHIRALHVPKACKDQAKDIVGNSVSII